MEKYQMIIIVILACISLLCNVIFIIKQRKLKLQLKEEILNHHNYSNTKLELEKYKSKITEIESTIKGINWRI